MRNLKFLSVLALLTLLLSVAFLGTATAQTPSPAQESAMVYFVSPDIALHVAMQEMTSYGITVEAFQRQYRVGNQVVTDGYFLMAEDKEQADIPAIEGRYWQSYGAMLQDVAQEIAREEQPILDPAAEAARQRYIDDIEQARKDFSVIEGCWATNSCPLVNVVSMLVSGDADALSEVANSSLVARVDVYPGQNSPGPTKTQTLITPAAIAPQNVPINTWVPKSGEIHIHPSAYPGERYIQNEMYWDTATRVSGFGPNSTYEHDFFLNDSDNSQYGPGIYLTEAEGWNGIPSVSYWSSNLPRPYLDTRLGDPGYVKAFTIGSADAGSIEHMVWYRNYIRAQPGTADIDNGYLQAQLGHRTPSSCYSTWCVFGDQIENIYSPYDVDPIPGDFFWVK